MVDTLNVGGVGVEGKTLSQLVPVKQTNDDALFVVDNGGSEYNTISASNLTKQVLKERDNVEELIDGKVNRSGDTMTGTLYSTANNNNFIVTSSKIDATSVPGSDICVIPVEVLDKNNKRFGCVECAQNSKGGNYIHLQASKIVNGSPTYAFLRVGFRADNSQFASSPDPSSSSNTNEIATTYWVRNLVKDFVVEYGGSSDQWYRVYNSGFKEQGGYRTGTAGWYTVTWTKPFNDANYTLTVGAVDSDNNAASQVGGVFNKTATSVQVSNTYAQFFTNPVMFYACGY